MITSSTISPVRFSLAFCFKALSTSATAPCVSTRTSLGWSPPRHHSPPHHNTHASDPSSAQAISFRDVIRIEKRSHVMVNPGIVIHLRSGTELEFYSFLDRDVSFALMVHAWDWHRSNMLTPRELELMQGKVGCVNRGSLPTLSLCLRRWQCSCTARAVEVWRLDAASCVWEEAERGRHCGWWWREVLKRAGMDQSKMRAMVMQRWRLYLVASALLTWRSGAVRFQMRACLERDRRLALSHALHRANQSAKPHRASGPASQAMWL